MPKNVRARTHKARQRAIYKERTALPRWNASRATSIDVISVWTRDKRICWLCEGVVAFEDASRDHVIEKRNGGTWEASNLRLAHAWCNSSRDWRYPHTNNDSRKVIYEPQ